MAGKGTGPITNVSTAAIIAGANMTVGKKEYVKSRVDTVIKHSDIADAIKSTTTAKIEVTFADDIALLRNSVLKVQDESTVRLLRALTCNEKLKYVCKVILQQADFVSSVDASRNPEAILAAKTELDKNKVIAAIGDILPRDGMGNPTLVSILRNDGYVEVYIDITAVIAGMISDDITEFGLGVDQYTVAIGTKIGSNADDTFLIVSKMMNRYR